MEKTVNEYLNDALELLAEYHPEPDDPLGGLDLCHWKRPFPQSGVEMQAYQDALITVGVFCVRTANLDFFKLRLVVDGSARSPIRVMLMPKVEK